MTLNHDWETEPRAAVAKIELSRCMAVISGIRGPHRDEFARETPRIFTSPAYSVTFTRNRVIGQPGRTLADNCQVCPSLMELNFNSRSFIDRRVATVFLPPGRAPCSASEKKIFIISTFRWESQTESDTESCDGNRK